MNFIHFSQGEDGYPAAISKYLNNNAPENITALGNIDILRQKMVALFCSVKCPGKLILQTYDLMQNLKEANVAIISGFHSPMEQECLTILLRGNNPVIICPARSIEAMRIGEKIKKPLETGRLLILSPFAKKNNRITLTTSLLRNRFIAALAESTFVAHAEPDGKTEKFCREILTWDKQIYTFASSFNTNLIEIGAKSVTHENIW